MANFYAVKEPMEEEDDENDEAGAESDEVAIDEKKTADSSKVEDDDAKAATTSDAKVEPSVVRMLPSSPGSWPWVMENVVYRALKLKSFLPPQTLNTDGSVLRVANLTELYKVFERCWAQQGRSYAED